MIYEETEITKRSVHAYVDGSYDRDSDRIGAGIAILYCGNIYTKSFEVPPQLGHAWNIDGECHATIEALRICTGEIDIQDVNIKETDITLNYDYEGIEKWANRKWKIKSNIAKFYVREFDRLVSKYKLNITFNKIKAHSGNPYNDIADSLAKEAIMK